MSDDGDDLKVRPGRVRQSGPGHAPTSFVAQVLKATHRAGGARARGRLGKIKRSTFGRGRGRAFAERGLFATERRVVVKARVVRHRGAIFDQRRW